MVNLRVLISHQSENDSCFPSTEVHCALINVFTQRHMTSCRTNDQADGPKETRSSCFIKLLRIVLIICLSVVDVPF